MTLDVLHLRCRSRQFKMIVPLPELLNKFLANPAAGICGRVAFLEDEDRSSTKLTDHTICHQI